MLARGSGCCCGSGCEFTDHFTAVNLIWDDYGSNGVEGDGEFSVDSSLQVLNATGTGSYTLRVGPEAESISVASLLTDDGTQTESGVTIRRADSSENVSLVRVWGTPDAYELRQGATVLQAFIAAGSPKIELRILDAVSGVTDIECYVSDVLAHIEVGVTFVTPDEINVGAIANGGGQWNWVKVSPCPVVGGCKPIVRNCGYGNYGGTAELPEVFSLEAGAFSGAGVGAMANCWAARCPALDGSHVLVLEDVQGGPNAKNKLRAWHGKLGDPDPFWRLTWPDQDHNGLESSDLTPPTPGHSYLFYYSCAWGSVYYESPFGAPGPGVNLGGIPPSEPVDEGDQPIEWVQPTWETLPVLSEPDCDVDGPGFVYSSATTFGGSSPWPNVCTWISQIVNRVELDGNLNFVDEKIRLFAYPQYFEGTGFYKTPWVNVDHDYIADGDIELTLVPDEDGVVACTAPPTITMKAFAEERIMETIYGCGDCKIPPALNPSADIKANGTIGNGIETFCGFLAAIYDDVTETWKYANTLMPVSPQDGSCDTFSIRIECIERVEGEGKDWWVIIDDSQDPSVVEPQYLPLEYNMTGTSANFSGTVDIGCGPVPIFGFVGPCDSGADQRFACCPGTESCCLPDVLTAEGTITCGVPGTADCSGTATTLEVSTIPITCPGPIAGLDEGKGYFRGLLPFNVPGGDDYELAFWCQEGGSGAAILDSSGCVVTQPTVTVTCGETSISAHIPNGYPVSNNCCDPSGSTSFEIDIH